MDARLVVRVAAVSLLAASGCARTQEVAHVPRLAFAAPIPSSSACALDEGPRVVAERARVASAEKAETRVILPRQRGGYLAVWIDGTVEEGYGVRAVALSADGAPLGSSFSVSEGTHAALGTLRARMSEDDRAVVAYYSSTDAGFDIVSASIVCTSP